MDLGKRLYARRKEAWSAALLTQRTLCAFPRTVQSEGALPAPGSLSEHEEVSAGGQEDGSFICSIGEQRPVCEANPVVLPVRQPVRQKF